jgi:hypothetical protein
MEHETLLCDSRIHSTREGDDLIVTWAAPRRLAYRFGYGSVLALWLAAWSSGGVFVLHNLFVEPPRGAQFAGIVIWLVGWACGVIAVGWVVFGLFRPARPHRLGLGSAMLRYRPAPALPVVGHRIAQEARSEYAQYGLARIHRALEIPRDEIGDIRLDQVGEDARLTVDRGAERYEIGQGMPFDDLRWLRDALVEWRGLAAKPACSQRAPAQSRITMRRESDGLFLEWMPPDRPLPRALCAIFTLACLGGWSAMGYAMLPSGNIPFAMWLAGEVIGAYVAIPLLRAPRSERLALSSGGLQYRPGSLPVIGSPAASDPPEQETKRIRNTLDLPRREIGAIHVERVGKRQRLVVTHGSGRYEIGAWLTEPDREWLYGLLCEWRHA